MALTLVTNPVETVGGVVQDIFAGFEDIEFVFKREDMTNVAITESSGKIKITTTSDLSSKLSTGDAVYIYAEGNSGTYDYDNTGLITAITATDIVVDIDYIENADASVNNYINYFKNYYLEVEVVNPDNSSVKVLPFTLRDDGDNAGNITINVGIVNDKNTIDFNYTTGQLTDSTIKFKIQYRQVYTLDDGDVTDSYTLISDEIILIYATKQPDYETFISNFDYPEIYKGYPNGVMLIHSDNNNDEVSLNVEYDELDINQNDLITGQSLTTYTTQYGMLFNDFSNITINDQTEYVRFKGLFVGLADFNATDFNSSDFATT